MATATVDTTITLKLSQDEARFIRFLLGASATTDNSRAHDAGVTLRRAMNIAGFTYDDARSRFRLHNGIGSLRVDDQ